MEKCSIARQTTDYNIIGCLHLACWIPRASNTHLEYVIFIDFSWQQWLFECASMLYVHGLPKA
jgi:hypothetical protein